MIQAAGINDLMTCDGQETVSVVSRNLQERVSAHQPSPALGSSAQRSVLLLVYVVFLVFPYNPVVMWTILPLPLKKSTARHQSDRLVHDNLANGQVVCDPGFCRLVLCDLVLPDAGPAVSVA